MLQISLDDSSPAPRSRGPSALTTVERASGVYTLDISQSTTRRRSRILNGRDPQREQGPCGLKRIIISEEAKADIRAILQHIAMNILTAINRLVSASATTSSASPRNTPTPGASTPSATAKTPTDEPSPPTAGKNGPFTSPGRGQNNSAPPSGRCELYRSQTFSKFFWPKTSYFRHFFALA